MGSIITSFKKLGKKDVRLLMLGLDAAGKTTVLYRLNLGETVRSIPTIGFNVEEVRYKKLQMQIWDIGGQDKIRPLWRHYYNKVDALIYVVDSSDTDRFDEAHLELKKVLSVAQLRGAPVLVFANKQDLPKASPIMEMGHSLGLHDLKDRKWHMQASVATTGEGLYEGLDWLSNALKK
mmetsp:Transcript_10978/g.12053  ORF Transcript_10978/g.12053 Transcript_10978/m.12053 type:complete len:178 (+) Transcript_10978:39-572(+)